VNVKTRRRLFVCLVAVALTLPIESILLRAVSAADPQKVAADWVTSLSAADVLSASEQVQLYPFAYRREIMRVLSPGQRADVWRKHILRYVDNHPNLDPSTAALLYNAAALATADTFSKPTDEVRSAIGIVAEQTSILLGKGEADYLFYRLGAPDGTFTSAEPIAQKLANYFRNVLVVQARGGDCDCSTSFGCNGQSGGCGGSGSCTRDETWPMCGWFWNDVCDGTCGASGS
jgi:hypothetical protein